ncbi:MAG: hypothetical protein U0031_06065 [Thermomicrobiales bacterium]
MSHASQDELEQNIPRAERRPILGFLGAAVVGGLLRLAPPAAAKPGKKPQDKCARQRGQCETWIRGRCADKTNPRTCFSDQVICCDFLAHCKFDSFVTCIKNISG